MKHKVFEQTVTVEGSNSFPIDMLRYDECSPASEADAHKIQRSIDHAEPMQVTLKRLRLYGYNMDFTPGRWSSFGWRIASTIETREK
jgi:hypothetical protein